MALTFLAGSNPPPPRLAGAPRVPSQAAMAAAEAALRRLTRSGAATTRTQALAELVLATGESNQGQTPAALQDFAAAAAYAPLQDVAVAGWTRCAVQAKDSAATLAAADKYQIAEQSPFRREIALRAAQAALETGQYAEVATWTRGLSDTAAVVWMRTQADDALGQHRAAGEMARVLVFKHPASNEAKLAADLWQRALVAYPDLAPDWRLYASQAEGWAGAGQPKQAVAGWRQAIAMAPATEQDRLSARLARALLAAGDRAGAADEAAKLLTGPEAAQAMELQLEMQRREHNAAALDPALQTMRQRFATSVWYARALHEAGDEALIGGDTAWTRTYFGRLSADFPHSTYGPSAAWQAAWAAYRRKDANAPRRIEQFLQRYPKSGQVVDALYWRGAWAQGHHEPGIAQACFRTAAARFAGTYFGLQARLAIKGAAPWHFPAWLRLFAVDPPTPHATPLPAALAPEIARADWLDSAGLLDAEARVLQAALRRQPRGASSLRLARRAADVDAAREQWQGGLSAMLR
ncbi:MAG: outer membrane protein assembly factor BamD, partial [Terriglobales bacterium]